jgi:hypothetical protein
MTDKHFTFEGCDSPAACREAMRPLLGAGMTWSEVHCGRCRCQGIVRHADLAEPEVVPDEAVIAAPAKAPKAEPAPVGITEDEGGKA